MKTEFMTKVTRLVGRAGLQIKKHSPEILMVAGIAGTVTSTVLACKATTKVNKILEEKNQQIDVIHESTEKGHVIGREDVEYTVEDSKKDLTIVYAQTGVKLAKLYAPAVGLGVLSIAAIVSGQQILKKRNIALAAAYAVVDGSFKDYRKRVVERFGENLDKELRYNIKAKEIEEIVFDKDGNEKVEKTIANVVDEDAVTKYSEFARFFDESSAFWQKNAEYNLMFLRRQQEYANQLLKSRGYVFLNEVYEMLGLQKAECGQVVGWIYDEVKPLGDNYIDFGIYDLNNEAKRAFVNGLERSILLDFNVDGVVYKLINQY